MKHSSQRAFTVYAKPVGNHLKVTSQEGRLEIPGAVVVFAENPYNAIKAAFPKSKELIQNYEVARFRAGETNEQGNRPERTIGTRAVICRDCGKVIAKGVERISVYYDFVGCGSWTSVMIHMHAQPCTALAHRVSGHILPQ